MALVGISALACVKTGEIGVRNATGAPILLSGFAECEGESSAGVYQRIEPGETVDQLVMWGTWVGDACFRVARLDLSRPLRVDAKSGRTYEVSDGAVSLGVRDVGPHDEPWYLDAQRFELGWSAWWVWLYGGTLLLGAPVGLFITVRFFYRFYVLKQR
jgi:hypothetical protein